MNTDCGTSVAASLLEAAKNANINVRRISPITPTVPTFRPRVKKLQPQIGQAGRGDLHWATSYRRHHSLFQDDAKNPGLPAADHHRAGDDSGFSDPSDPKRRRSRARRGSTGCAFDIGKPGSNSFIVNKLFHDKYGRDLDDTSARWMQGLFVLADAINRAGSTDAEKIREALNETDLKAEQLMIGYKAWRCRSTPPWPEHGLASTFPSVSSCKGNQPVPVWPENLATDKLELPMKGWR